MLRVCCGLCVLVLGVAVAQSLAHARNWTDQTRTGRFVVHADFRLQGHEPLIRQLGGLERDVTATLQIRANAEPVHLFLFQTKESYQQYLDHYFAGAPQRRALFIKGSTPGWVFTYVNPQLEVDVRHECTHALLHSQLPMVPLWLDEGLAEYFEVPPDKRLKDNPHMSATKWAARFHRYRELGELEDLRDVRQMGNAEYRAAWAWVHFMLHGPPEARQVLLRYLRDLQANVPPGLLSERLERNIPDLNKQFLSHFSKWRG